MARDMTPIVKRSRREGVALHPKAYKIMVRRKNGPGSQAGGRRNKPSQFALQLREKQKVKRLYGLLEKQFRRIIEEALRSQGVTGEILLQLLERRLDNAVYRLHWAPSRQGARQLVTHGHILVNGHRVTVPSIRLKPGDEIAVREKSQKGTYFENLKKALGSDLASYSWLSSTPKSFKAKVTGLPQRDEAEPEINEQLIVEFYSR